jgi:orotidine-5'-phosphate decarboxylase
MCATVTAPETAPQTVPTARALIAPRERLIVALDVPDVAQAKALVERIGEGACFYKVGLELFTAETVRRAVANLAQRGATFATVHAHRSILEAAVAEKRAMQLLAVTVLTSFDARDLAEMGSTHTVDELVLKRAAIAADAGCDGVICSGLEAPKIKAAFGQRLLAITPGIRPVTHTTVDDQKRTVDVAQAFQNGADYIVVGRPIRDAQDPRAAALSIQATIAAHYSST